MEALQFKNLEVRLAESESDIRSAQFLRYRVFYEEWNAKPTSKMATLRRDFDKFDEHCDHLLVIDRDRSNGDAHVIGTYRLLRGRVANRNGGFYSEGEYDLASLHTFPGEILELGRSCVDSEYRSRAVMQLLWRGLASYIGGHGVELMFGCASFPGIKKSPLRVPLSYLYHFHLAPDAIRTKALSHRYIKMNRMPRSWINVKKAMNLLPPMIKGYLRVGGYVGEGAVIDRRFNTTDVCIVVKTAQITDRYQRHFMGESDPSRMVA
ncbi:MAG TPA: GNAT family N-acetyltransferase [Alphaproteobacteria bacterium]|nr:GNAT family N-acetyltransferase [Alphaproteobacteria bacterium]